MKKISGAKGIGSFSTGISYGILPSPSSLAHEGIIDDYYFETNDEKEKLFKTNYVCAISKDPFSGKMENYVCVNCSSCLDGEGLKKIGRPNLNLTILLDISGSMRNTFSGTGETKSKLEIAKESILTLLSKLKQTDSFSLLSFDDNVDVLQPLSKWDPKTSGPLKEKLAQLQVRGGTDIAKGMSGAANIYKSLPAEIKENENRIIVVTDAELTVGEEIDVVRITKECAAKRIYTTFIGVGIDFNTNLVSQLSSIRGQNYLSVKSSKEFKKEMDDEFDYLVTPIVFNANIIMEDTSIWQPVRVYGSPGCEIPDKGKLFSVNSSFPSLKENPTITKGGAIVIKLENVDSSKMASPILLKVSYEDTKGKVYQDIESFQFPSIQPNEEFYGNISARKAILLVRYVNFMKFFLTDCLNFKSSSKQDALKPSVNLKSNGLPIPPVEDKGKNHSVSQPLFDPTYKEALQQFVKYMEKEMEAIQDKQLDRELKSLVSIVDKVEKEKSN